MIPKTSVPCIDIRDVAQAHIDAITNAEATGMVSLDNYYNRKLYGCIAWFISEFYPLLMSC